MFQVPWLVRLVAMLVWLVWLVSTDGESMGRLLVELVAVLQFGLAISTARTCVHLAVDTCSILSRSVQSGSVGSFQFVQSGVVTTVDSMLYCQVWLRSASVSTIYSLWRLTRAALSRLMFGLFWMLQIVSWQQDVNSDAVFWLHFFVCLYATSCLVRFMKLYKFNLVRASEARRAHPVRPPPKPDPLLSNVKSTKRIYSDQVRQFESDQRLLRRAETEAQMRFEHDWLDMVSKLRAVYIPFFIMGSFAVSQHLSIWWQLLVAASSVWLSFQWFIALWHFLADALDAWSRPEFRPCHEQKLLTKSCKDMESFFGCFESIYYITFDWIREALSSAVLRLVAGSLGATYASALHLIAWCGFWPSYTMASISMVLSLALNLLHHVCTNKCANILILGMVLLEKQSSYSHGALQVDSIVGYSVTFLLLLPPLHSVLRFILRDTYEAFFAPISDDSLLSDVESLLDGSDDWSLADEAPLVELSRSRTTKTPPLLLKPPSKLSRALQLLLIPFMAVSSTSKSDPVSVGWFHPLSLQASSVLPAGFFDDNAARNSTHTAEQLSWRRRRQFRRTSEKIESRIYAKLLGLGNAAISSSPPARPDDWLLGVMTDEFLSQLNPATEGSRWQMADHMDRVLMRRVPLRTKDMEKVSVGLKTCLASSNLDFCFIQAIETAFNALGHSPEAPLIVDSGASCCITPNIDDFVSYNPSKVKIKDLSGVNKVAGEGMVRWKVTDRFGSEYSIEVKAYHIPKAAVRLLSPQSLYQDKLAVDGSQNEHMYSIKLKDGTILDAPYGAANLPLLQLSNPRQPSCFWHRCFSFHGTDEDLWTRNVLDARNQNITAAQKEILRWHHRLSHACLATIHNLCRQKRQLRKATKPGDLQPVLDGPTLPCTFNVPSASCVGLLCAACETSKATRKSPTIRPTSSRAPKEMVLKEGHLDPGDCVSCDHFFSPVAGRIMAESGYSSSRHGHNCGTIYIDHATGFIFAQTQKSVAADETIRGKLLLEKEGSDVGVKIKSYHSDNGIFSGAEFTQHCADLQQTISFSGVGAKFQNGIAENAIKTVTNMARANMLHATMCWPGRSFIDLWPFAIQYAIWVHNRLPQNGNGWSPVELWSKTKGSNSHLQRAHSFGCPVYVLDARLQDNKPIPKWDSKARQGIFVGFSPFHSTSVPLILNPTSQHISPQFHVVFDDDFSTVPSISSPAQRDARFEQLFELSSARERYVDPDDVDAVGELDEWQTAADVQVDSPIPSSASSTVPVAATPSPSSTSASCSASPPSLHRNEQRPPISSSSSPPSEQRTLRPRSSDWKDGPALDRNHHDGRWKTGLSILPLALSAAWEWCQRPAPIANASVNHLERCSPVRVRHSTLNELALLSGDWDTLGRDACDGKYVAFSSYFEPDLADDIGSYTITNVQPHFLKAASNDSDNPTFNQVRYSPFAKEWWESMRVELHTLEHELGAWELVDREDWMNVLPSTWAFRLKRFPNGLMKKFKARFCVRGDKQLEGVDFFETWSPVIQWTTVRTIMLLATKMELHSAQADITAAFVHADLKPGEEIYVHQPAGFNRGKNKVLKLKKTVYGLKQAPRYFFKYLTKHLESQGLRQSYKDPCLFVGDTIVAVVYVDDILFFSKNEDDIKRVVSKLKDAGIAIRLEGSAEGFLGVDVSRSSDSTGRQRITFTQKGLTLRIIEALGLHSDYSTAISTPAEASPLPKDSEGAPAFGSFNYPAVVGMMLYLSGHSRPDIAFAVNQCARYTFKPSRRHELAMIRIGRYLKGTVDKGLIMTPSDDPRIDCYPDADFAGLYGHENSQDPHCARSRTGYVILAFGCPIVWRSNLQSEIALSTMEAEYVALSTACKDLVPVTAIVKELSRAVGFSDSVASNLHIKVHEDNVGALTLANLEPRRMTPRSKHYAIKYHWFREYVANPVNKVSIVKIDSKNQLGDMFTKGLTTVTFEYLRRLLMGW